MKIILDDINGIHSSNIEISDANQDQVLNFLDKLDGKKHTLLSLNRINGDYLLIGGGKNELIICLNKNNLNFTLFNELKKTNNYIELCIGGQFGEFNLNIVHDYKTSINVINHFFNYSEDNLNWKI